MRAALYVPFCFCFALVPGLAQATIVHRTFEYPGAAADGNVAFDVGAGWIDVGATTAPPLGFLVLPSNAGQNVQVHFAPGSGSGAVVTSGAPSYLAEDFAPGAVIGPALPEDTQTLPGYSSAYGLGGAKIRFFGTGNFANGEPGYIGFRLGPPEALRYGWARIQATDGSSFLVHEAAYEDSGLPIAVGDVGPAEGVLRVSRSGFGNIADVNWPPGDWWVAALLVDGYGRSIGHLSRGFQFNAINPLVPSSVSITMEGTALDLSAKVRVFRRQGGLAPGDTGVEFADYPCDETPGLCDASFPVGIPGGHLANGDFTRVGTVPDGRRGLSALRRGGAGNFAADNWPAGSWEIRALLVDAQGRAIGDLTPPLAFFTTGSGVPTSVELEVFDAAEPEHRVRVYRSLAPIFPGTPNVQFAEYSCDFGFGSVAGFCHSAFGASPIEHPSGRLPNDSFTHVGRVPDETTAAPSTPQWTSSKILAFPNPFNPRTTLSFELSGAAEVTIGIHDARGRKVRELAAGHRDAGNHEVVWDGRDSGGRAVASGVYLVELRAGAERRIQKIGLVR